MTNTTQAAKPILEARSLRKAFGGLVAVDGVDIKIYPHRLHSIIGPNGAGKTTLFNLLSGVLKPTAGSIFYRGKDITQVPSHRIAHLGIGRSFQITNIFPNLSVLENIRLAAQAVGRDSFRLLRRADRFRSYHDKASSTIEQVGLVGREAALASALPHGDKRKLELAIMLASDPEILLLDEPTGGMSTEEVPALLQVIDGIMQAGDRTIVLVEHRMDVVMNISDYITVMHQGRVLAEGTPKEITQDELVQQAYLGALYGDLSETVEG